MTKQPTLLIFGCLPPADPLTAAYTAHTAQLFQAHADVVVVISDLAPPPNVPDASDIPFIRERDLSAKAAPYADAKRLYILGDTHESLWALKLLTAAPGGLLFAGSSMHSLWRLYLETQDDWPANYISWLHSALPADAVHTIEHILVSKGRESHALHADIPARNTIEHLATISAHTPLPLTAPLRNMAQPSNSPPLIVPIITECGNKTFQAALTALKQTGQTTSCIPEAEDATIATLTAADIVVILADEDTFHPALTAALAAGKAIIGGGPWTTRLPNTALMKIPHTEALHNLVCALGALADHSIRGWQQTEALAFYKGQQQEAPANDFIKSVLSTPVASLDILPIIHASKAKPAPIASAQNTPLEGQIALVGTIPPKAILQEWFPNLQLSICPRFATPELAARLAFETNTPAPLILADMGYEQPLIDPIGKSASTAVSMESLQKDFKKPLKAVSFCCSVKGAIPIDIPLNQQTLQVTFPPIKQQRKKQQYRGFDAETSLYWQLDTIEHTLKCLLSVGTKTPVRVALNSVADDAFLMATPTNTEVLSKASSVTLSPDHLALITFQLALLGASGRRISDTGLLIEALQSIKLIIQPLHEGTESEKVIL